MNIKVARTAPDSMQVTATVTFSTTMGETDQPYRIDWGDGTAIAPIGAGAAPQNHIYAKAGTYEVWASANDVRVHAQVTVQDLTHPLYPVFDPIKAPPVTVKDQQAEELEQAKAVMGSRRNIGAPSDKGIRRP